MNKIITLISICFILLTNLANAQKLEYETTSPWFWGMNVGGAWNTTDVKNQTNYGWGITVGRSLNFDAGNAFSFDIRGRYLGGQWKGQDNDSTSTSSLAPGSTLNSGNTNYDTLLGYGVNNFATKAHEFDLELVIHLNRLVANTGLDPYIFGGIGLTAYNTRGNLINDQNGLLYDYNSLSNFSKSSLDGLLDKSYETPLDGSSNSFNIAAMPSLGVGLGYFMGKRFSMGVEHKTTFSLVDNFDGYIKPNPSNALFKNDIYHYTSLYFKYYFKHRGETNTNTNPGPIGTTGTTNGINSGNGGCQKPIIRITNPNNNETVKDPNLVVIADVAHASSRDNITVSVNGVNTTNYSYSTQTNKLQGSGYLQVGQNTIVITATNSCGSTSETMYVNYVQDCQTPTVRFTNPSNSGITVNSSTLYVTADVFNLTKDQSLTFNVNGIKVNNYSFNSTTGKFSATINIKEGTNNIELFATNNCGTSSSAIAVNYAVNCPAPIIQSINSVSGITVNSATYNLEAQFKNITASNQISVKVNGASQGLGQYVTSSGWLKQNIRLNPGQNIVEITTTNNCGTASQTVVVNYEAPCDNPTAKIVTPATSGQNVSASNYSFVGQLTNVSNSSDITLLVNGVSLVGFSYNSVVGKITRAITLQQGANTIELIAKNNCGTIKDITVINYNYTCPKPTVQLLSPVNNPTVTVNNYTVQAFVSNISNANQVVLKVNGVVRSGGTYTTGNSMYKNTVALQEGNNTIEVIATNSCGNASTSGNVNRRIVPTEEPKPVITMTGTCDATVEAGQHYISGFISSVSSASQVTITVNNSVVSSINYAPVSQGLNFGFNLPVTVNPDTYVIVITAQNTGGTVTKTCVIKVHKPEEKITICHIPPGNNQNPQTIEIPLSAWPAHQAHGDKLGACVEVVDEDITICILENGVLTTKVIKKSQWTHYQSLGAKLGKCPEVEEKITICHIPPGNNQNPQTIEIPLSAWPAHQAHGDKLGACVEVVEDEDIVICVKVNGKQTTMTIKQSQWTAYQGKGATLGKCPEEEQKLTICHIPPGNNQNPQTIEIPLSAWPAHQAHGDKLGACVEVVEDEDIVICVKVNGKQTTMTIKQSQWSAYQEKGATLGKCPEVVVVDPNIVICIEVNGKPTTKTIKQSQWAAYKAKGATMGKCTEPVVDQDIVICVEVNGKPTTMTIKQSQWSAYQEKGATLGKCPEVVVVDPNIVICIEVNGKPTTKTIKQSQWAAYKAKGATLGKCTETDSETETDQSSGTLPGQLDPDVTICVEENGVGITKTIKKSELQSYLDLGATEGACTEPKLKGRGGNEEGVQPRGGRKP